MRSIPFAVAFATSLLRAKMQHQPLPPPAKKKRRLNLESQQRRRLVGAKGMRP
ncbi:hypothetical protein [Methylobacterium sp. JK268]